MSGKFHSAIKQWNATILALIGMSLSIYAFLSPLINPEWFISQADEAMIEEKVHNSTHEEFMYLMSGKYGKDSTTIYNNIK